MKTENETQPTEKPVASGDLLETFWECRFGSSSYVVERIDDVMNELRDAELGEAYTIQKIEMKRKDFEALAEFNGF